MIEINLLPGAKKGKRSGGGGGPSIPSINFAAIGAAISARVQDKFLAAAVATSVIVLAAIGYLWWSQRQTEAAVRAAEAKAVADSTRYAEVLADRMRAQARRDSAFTQFNIIKTIDEDRYIWPHILEEVSRALPPFTWLQTMNFIGTAQGTNPAAAMKTPPPDTSARARRRPRVDPVIPRDTVRFQMVGRTVDIQALTRFMRSLEESPFLEGVTFQRTAPTIEAGKDVTQFTLEVTYTRPDTLLLRRVPFTASQR